MKISNNTDTNIVVTYPKDKYPTITIPARGSIEVGITDKEAFTAMSIYLQCKEKVRTGQIVIEGGPIII